VSHRAIVDYDLYDDHSVFAGNRSVVAVISTQDKRTIRLDRSGGGDTVIDRLQFHGSGSDWFVVREDDSACDRVSRQPIRTAT